MERSAAQPELPKRCPKRQMKTPNDTDGFGQTIVHRSMCSIDLGQVEDMEATTQLLLDMMLASPVVVVLLVVPLMLLVVLLVVLVVLVMLLVLAVLVAGKPVAVVRVTSKLRSVLVLLPLVVLVLFLVVLLLPLLVVLVVVVLVVLELLVLTVLMPPDSMPVKPLVVMLVLELDVPLSRV